jgi:integrase
VATIAKVNENITTYTFRHSWATIAQNDCKALNTYIPQS